MIQQEHLSNDESQEPGQRPLLQPGDTLVYPGFGSCVLLELDKGGVLLRSLKNSNDVMGVELTEFAGKIESFRSSIERHVLAIGSRIRLMIHGQLHTFEVLASPSELVGDGNVKLMNDGAPQRGNARIPLKDLQAGNYESLQHLVKKPVNGEPSHTKPPQEPAHSKTWSWGNENVSAF